MKTWKMTQHKVFVTTDQSHMVKNVGYKCWGLFVNDGSADWDIDWVGSTYPTARAAMESIWVTL